MKRKPKAKTRPEPAPKKKREAKPAQQPEAKPQLEASAGQSPATPAKRHASQVDVARRVEDILRIRLDGAEWWDIRDYVRAQEAAADSAWFLAAGESPLSESQIRRYQQQADELVMQAHERSRKKIFRRHLAQRRSLYARAVTTGELRTALACLQDEADLLGFYKNKVEHSGRVDVALVETLSDEELARIAASGKPN